VVRRPGAGVKGGAVTGGADRSGDVIVVGGGIVGCTTAYFLAREGLKPLLLERSDVAAEASGANAGLVGERIRGPRERAIEGRRLPWRERPESRVYIVVLTVAAANFGVACEGLRKNWSPLAGQ